MAGVKQLYDVGPQQFSFGAHLQKSLFRVTSKYRRASGATKSLASWPRQGALTRIMGDSLERRRHRKLQRMAAGAWRRMGAVKGVY